MSSFKTWCHERSVLKLDSIRCSTVRRTRESGAC